MMHNRLSVLDQRVQNVFVVISLTLTGEMRRTRVHGWTMRVHDLTTRSLYKRHHDLLKHIRIISLLNSLQKYPANAYTCEDLQTCG